MDYNKMVREICGDEKTAASDPHSARCCSVICRFFLGESEKTPGMALCSNADYIRFHEACLSVFGAECDYCTTDEIDEDDSIHISLDHTGKDYRQSSRNLVYNIMQIGIAREIGIVEYPSIILDVSLKGIGCIVPVIMESFPQEFYLTKHASFGNVIKLMCITRRVRRHSSVTEIGANFRERISEELLASLLRIG
ncbi:MAG TPA: hypothetical protein VEF34_15110 [Syntrophobacteraceae bacterium]|nr:hypothetical protein [Syntrophobacteraceae bacterium]